MNCFVSRLLAQILSWSLPRLLAQMMSWSLSRLLAQILSFFGFWTPIFSLTNESKSKSKPCPRPRIVRHDACRHSKTPNVTILSWDGLWIAAQTAPRKPIFWNWQVGSSIIQPSAGRSPAGHSSSFCFNDARVLFIQYWFCEVDVNGKHDRSN